ncbi:MAG: hypothetical protein ACE5H3_01715 [Planctomycetota bacterium]
MRALVRFSSFLFLLVLALPGCRKGADPALALSFQKAIQAFREAKTREEYLLVAAGLEDILKTGVPSAALYYDLGNAFARAGEKGRAVAAYRQALRLRPRDPYFRNNLRLTQGSSPSLDGRKKTLLDNLVFWEAWLSQGELAWLAAGLGLAAFLISLGVLVRPQSITLRRLRWFFLLLVLVAGASYLLQTREQAPGRHGVLLHGKVEARTGDSETYEPAFADPLPAAAEFEVIEERGSWLHIRLPSGPEGWVKQKDAVIY